MSKDINTLLAALDADTLTALKALVTQDATEAEDTTPSQQDAAEALAEAHGLQPTRGRVYLSGDTIKAAARVAKGGNPEVVTATNGRATHLVLWLADNGEVAAQNYYKA